MRCVLKIRIFQIRFWDEYTLSSFINMNYLGCCSFCLKFHKIKKKIKKSEVRPQNTSSSSFVVVSTNIKQFERTQNWIQTSCVRFLILQGKIFVVCRRKSQNVILTRVSSPRCSVSSSKSDCGRLLSGVCVCFVRFFRHLVQIAKKI